MSKAFVYSKYFISYTLKNLKSTCIKFNSIFYTAVFYDNVVTMKVCLVLFT